MPNPIVTETENQKWLKEYITNYLVPSNEYGSEELITTKPQYWGIMNYRKQMVPEGYEDEVEYYEVENCETYTPSELIEHFIEYNIINPNEILIEVERYLSYEYEDQIKFDENGHLQKNIEEAAIINFADAIIQTFSMESEYYKNYLITESFIAPNVMFLTKEEANAHLKANYYHYHQNAHIYCMYPWRAPDTQRLLKTLMLIDFDKSNIVFKENQ